MRISDWSSDGCSSDLQRIGIGKGGPFTTDGADPHTLPDRKTASLDDTFFEAPAFAARVLEIQVGIIDLMGEDFAQRAGHIRFSQAPWVEQQRFGRGQGLNIGIDQIHKFCLYRTRWRNAGSDARTDRKRPRLNS